MKYARIRDGIVAELFDEKPEFHPEIMVNIRECPLNTQQNDVFDHETEQYSRPDQPIIAISEPSEIQVRLLALEEKIGITALDKQAARSKLVAKE